MATTTFDTLKYANTLKAAGVPEKQAEAHANVLAEAFAGNFKDLVTKDDLRATEQRLEVKIDNLTARFEGQFTLIKWMIGVTSTLVVTVLIRLFFGRSV